MRLTQERVTIGARATRTTRSSRRLRAPKRIITGILLWLPLFRGTMDRLPRLPRGYGRRVARLAEPPHPRPRSRAQRHPPLHRGPDDPRHYGGLIREGIRRA